LRTKDYTDQNKAIEPTPQRSSVFIADNSFTVEKPSKIAATQRAE
jgi:hypothetical protein